MEISKLFGLPAHPLIVHIPVVLLPIAVIGAILMVFSASWRTRIGWLVVIAAGVSLLFVQLAIGSGEALQESVAKSDLVMGIWRDPLMATITVAVPASAVLSGIWVYRAGHSGAESVWSKVQTSVGDSGESGDEESS